jgi:hypothetical protein
MEDEEEYTMTEQEYKSKMMKKEIKQKLDVKDDDDIENVSELAESDCEKNNADVEDQDEWSEFSEEDDYEVPDWINNSFTGPYSNVEDIHLDKGKPQQFDEILLS